MAPMADDHPYDEYEKAIQKMAAASPAGFAAAPAGAYRLDVDGFVPQPRPGCTVLAEPYPITSFARERLARLQDVLRVRCPGFAAVPVQTLHLTVADLISREAYTGLGPREAEEFCAKAARILASCGLPENAQGTVAGVGALPSGVVALVSFSPAVYQALIAVREALYAGLSLPQTYAFTGHITLGYVEIPAGSPGDQHEQAKEAVRNARQVLAQDTPVTFLLDRLAVFTFPHMSRFDLWTLPASQA